MAAASNGPSGFFSDLSRIRVARDISLEALHEETKIPINLLHEFEETGLADHPMFNRVYLRSLVRAYAEVIDIEEEAALNALEAYLAGSYSGSLTSLYLDEGPPDESQTTPDEYAASEDALEEDASMSEGPEPVNVLPPAGRQPHTPLRRELPLRRPEDSESAADWDSVSPAPTSQRREPIDVGQHRSLLQWSLVIIAVLVLAGIIWLIFTLVKGGEETTAQLPVSVEDTTLARPDTTVSPSRPRIALGDTMDVVVIAEGGPVTGIRITRDTDLRRPYWIEEGEAKAFPALQRIVLEEQLNVIRLLLEGYDYPTDRRDDQGRIVLTRTSAQAFLDTLQGEPSDLSQDPELVRKGLIQNQ